MARTAAAGIVCRAAGSRACMLLRHMSAAGRPRRSGFATWRGDFDRIEQQSVFTRKKTIAAIELQIETHNRLGKRLACADNDPASRLAHLHPRLRRNTADSQGIVAVRRCFHTFAVYIFAGLQPQWHRGTQRRAQIRLGANLAEHERAGGQRMAQQRCTARAGQQMETGSDGME